MIRTLTIAVVVAFVAGFAWELSAEPIDPGSVPPAPAPASPAPMKELTDAADRFNQRDYAGALKLLEAAVKKDPNLPPAHIILAQFFAQSSNSAGVRNSLEQAVVESPNDPQAFLVLGDIAMRERRITEARLLFEKADVLLAQWKGSAKRKDAMMPQLYSGLAATAEARGNWAEARQPLEKWLAIDPKSAAALQRLAQCLFRDKDVPGALEKLQAAAKTDAEMLPPEAVLAQWFARSGDQESAKKYLVAALNASPKNPQVRLVAAQWAWELGEFADAEKQADAALQLDPQYYQAKILRGVIALFRKDYPAAEMYFESAHLQAPKDYAASNNLALALAEQKDEKKRNLALQYAENNVKQYPRMADAYSTYGWILYKLGRLQDAEAALRKSISGGTFSAETAFYLACVLADRGQDADAMRLLQGAIQTPTPFAQRDEAKALLAQLQKTQPQQTQPLPDLPAQTPAQPEKSPQPPQVQPTK